MNYDYTLYCQVRNGKHTCHSDNKEQSIEKKSEPINLKQSVSLFQQQYEDLEFEHNDENKSLVINTHHNDTELDAFFKNPFSSGIEKLELAVDFNKIPDSICNLKALKTLHVEADSEEVSHLKFPACMKNMKLENFGIFHTESIDDLDYDEIETDFPSIISLKSFSTNLHSPLLQLDQAYQKIPMPQLQELHLDYLRMNEEFVLPEKLMKQIKKFSLEGMGTYDRNTLSFLNKFPNLEDVNVHVRDANFWLEGLDQVNLSNFKSLQSLKVDLDLEERHHITFPRQQLEEIGRAHV